MSISDLNKVSLYSLLALIFFAIYFYLVGYKEEIPLYMEVMRVVITLHYCSLLYAALRIKMSKELLYLWIFLSFVLISLGLQYWRIAETKEIFGDSADSYTYMYYVTKYNHYSLPDFWHALLHEKSHPFNVDDLGFTTIIYFLAKPFGRDYQTIAGVLILCNAVTYVIGIGCFHKLSEKLVGDDKRALAATILWAGFSHLITTSAGGAKEVFFLTFIIIAMYSIYRYKEKPTLLRLISAILLISINYFFRYAICGALVFSLICIIIVNEQNKRTIVKSAFFAILFTFPILTFLLPLITGGITLEHILWVTGNRMDSMQGSFLTKLIVPPFALLFGPFPNLDRMNSSGFLYAYSLFLKDFLSIYFLSSFVQIIKAYKYEYYPILTFVFCNMLMLIVAGVSLDIRYHLTYIPFFFLICMVPHEYGVNKTLKTYIFLCLCIVIYAYAHRQFEEEHIQSKSSFINRIL